MRKLLQVGVGLLLLVAQINLELSRPASAQTEDALVRRVRSELRVFTDWLVANNARGAVTEAGWPDAAFGDHEQWNALADTWYRDADAARLWVTSWATGEWWGTSYKLAAYEDRVGGAGVDSADTQAAVVEAHPGNASYLRGINVAGGEFASPSSQPTSNFSNENPGHYGSSYHYDTQATFNYLASRGISIVRIPFRWERLQPVLGHPLDGNELQRLKAVVARARTAGLRVILDMHNYGAYYLSDGTYGRRRAIGSGVLPIKRFAEVWGRISNHFKSDQGVAAYGLMNEPVGLPGSTPARIWEQASQKALDRIRMRGDNRLVLVPGYFWSGAQNWPRQHPTSWIVDRTNNFRYDAHHYWDRDNSGTYANTYISEVANATSRGY